VVQERGPLSLVNITKELLVRKDSSSGVEHRDYGRTADHETHSIGKSWY
jgi:hypothetical protein